MNDFPHILIQGNPVDGFTYVGPFKDFDAALRYAETDPGSEADWWLTPLHAPAEEPNVMELAEERQMQLDAMNDPRLQRGRP